MSSVPSCVIFGNILAVLGLDFGLKLAFVVTKFHTGQRDYKLVPFCVHDSQSPINANVLVIYTSVAYQIPLLFIESLKL